jgi:hypothetical protein
MLAAGMAQGAIVYHDLNVNTTPGGSAINFDLDADGTNDFKVFFDGTGATKPCVQSLSNTAIPTPWVFNEVDMDANNNGMPVIPAGTVISNEFTVGTNTVSPGVDSEGNHRGYLYQSTTGVGQWPTDQDTVGYVGLAMTDTTVTPATTNYGWAQIEWNPTNQPNPTLTVIGYAYQTIANSNIITGEIPSFPPVINASPTNQTTYAGSAVSMYVNASADPAPAYQWMAGAVGSGIYTNVPNAGNFFGADTSTLMISNVIPANQLDYIVVVTNILGSATSIPPATLTVLPAGLTGPVPAQQVIYAGYPAQFTVTDLGGGAITNSWRFNSTNLSNGGVYSGATSTNLVISSVTPADLGNYSAIVRTAYGAATSSVAPLGIAYPDGSLYESAVRAYGAVDYYRLNETSGTAAWDFIGGKTGTYGTGYYGTDPVFGQAGPTSDTSFPGFVSTNYAATFSQIDTNYITCLPWNLNTNTVTITAWIYPQYNQGNAGIVFTAGAGNMVCGIRYDASYINTTNNIDEGDIGYSWNNDYGAGQWNSFITAPWNQWSLVALAVSPTDATLYIINANGVQSAVDTRNHDPAAFNAPECIGYYPLEGGANFNGNIDEVAIFKSTLSSNQVYSLYESALGQNIVPPALTLTPVGNDSQVRWTGGVLLQATNLVGPWITNTAATSPYTVSPTNPQQFFRAKQ